MGKNYLKCLILEFNNKVTDLVSQKEFYRSKYMSGFERFKEKFLSRQKFYSISMSISMFLTFGINLKWKQWKIMTTYT